MNIDVSSLSLEDLVLYIDAIGFFKFSTQRHVRMGMPQADALKTMQGLDSPLDQARTELLNRLNTEDLAVARAFVLKTLAEYDARIQTHVQKVCTPGTIFYFGEGIQKYETLSSWTFNQYKGRNALFRELDSNKVGKLSERRAQNVLIADMESCFQTISPEKRGLIRLEDQVCSQQDSVRWWNHAYLGDTFDHEEFGILEFFDCGYKSEVPFALLRIQEGVFVEVSGRDWMRVSNSSAPALYWDVKRSGCVTSAKARKNAYILD